MKKANKIKPSILANEGVMDLYINLSFESRITRIAASRPNGISFQTVFFVIFNGKITDEIPSITKILKILLPMILPNAISVLFARLALKFTKNSGIDVPKATTVNPITKSETRSLLAKDEAPSTRKCAPKIRSKKPTTK